jgi:chromate reductase, NAD(P)H dehydrogenase (quinone)
MKIKILALCGSSRRDSLNQKLLDIAALGAVDAGAQVSLMRWPDFPLPIYDGDWEAEHGLPERARAQSIMRCWSLPPSITAAIRRS